MLTHRLFNDRSKSVHMKTSPDLSEASFVSSSKVTTFSLTLVVVVASDEDEAAEDESNLFGGGGGGKMDFGREEEEDCCCLMARLGSRQLSLLSRSLMSAPPRISSSICCASAGSKFLKSRSSRSRALSATLLLPSLLLPQGDDLAAERIPDAVVRSKLWWRVDDDDDDENGSTDARPLLSPPARPMDKLAATGTRGKLVTLLPPDSSSSLSAAAWNEVSSADDDGS